MSDNTEKRVAEDASPSLLLKSLSPAAGGPEGVPDGRQSNHLIGPIPPDPDLGEDPTEALKQRLEETRLPAHLKEWFFAELPPEEERERMYRELQENGGFSFEQLFDSLDPEVEPQP
jgi:hypothetical protein